jgi:hypothetical protein
MAVTTIGQLIESINLLCPEGRVPDCGEGQLAGWISSDH